MRQLSQDEIISCAAGSLQTRQAEQGLHLMRFNDAAMENFNLFPAWQKRTVCTAGVMLDLVTDSRTITVAVQSGVKIRKWAYFDAYADGLFTGTFGGIDLPEKVEFTLPLGSAKGRRRVQLYLPHSQETFIQAVGLDDGASFEPAWQGKLLMAMGDSITQGMECRNPSLTYIATACRSLGLALHNCGVGGHEFHQECLRAVLAPKPDLITVAYGVNDWRHDQSVNNAHDFLRRLRELYPAVPVVVLEPIWVQKGSPEGLAGKPNATGITLAEYRRMLIETVAGIQNMRCIPTADLLPPGPIFMPDGIHPGDHGHMVYGLNVARILSPLFR